MGEIFESMGLPYLHCSWDVRGACSQRDRYAKLIRLALGKLDCESLPAEECLDESQWFVRGRVPMAFHPMTVHEDMTCGHFFGITSFNYDNRTPFTPAPRGLHCSFCARRFDTLPLEYDFLMNFGCAPPIPLLVVGLCFAGKFRYKPDVPVPPLPFGLVPGGGVVDVG
jgi:hypothetical protein